MVGWEERTALPSKKDSQIANRPTRPRASSEKERSGGASAPFQIESSMPVSIPRPFLNTLRGVLFLSKSTLARGWGGGERETGPLVKRTRNARGSRCRTAQGRQGPGWGVRGRSPNCLSSGRLRESRIEEQPPDGDRPLCWEDPQCITLAEAWGRSDIPRGLPLPCPLLAFSCWETCGDFCQKRQKRTLVFQ